MHKLATAQLIQYKAGIKLQKTEGYIQTNHPFATYKITDRVEATMNKYEHSYHISLPGYFQHTSRADLSQFRFRIW